MVCGHCQSQRPNMDDVDKIIVTMAVENKFIPHLPRARAQGIYPAAGTAAAAVVLLAVTSNCCLLLSLLTTASCCYWQLLADTGHDADHYWSLLANAACP